MVEHAKVFLTSTSVASSVDPGTVDFVLSGHGGIYYKPVALAVLRRIGERLIALSEQEGVVSDDAVGFASALVEFLNKEDREDD